MNGDPKMNSLAQNDWKIFTKNHFFFMSGWPWWGYGKIVNATRWCCRKKINYIFPIFDSENTMHFAKVIFKMKKINWTNWMAVLSITCTSTRWNNGSEWVHFFCYRRQSNGFRLFLFFQPNETGNWPSPRSKWFHSGVNGNVPIILQGIE